jgi:hypothetical protein
LEHEQQPDDAERIQRSACCTPSCQDYAKQALIQKRMDLERKRRMDEYDQRAQARGLKVKDTLEKIGLGK